MEKPELSGIIVGGVVISSLLVGFFLGTVFVSFSTQKEIPNEATVTKIHGASLLTAEIPADWAIVRLGDGSPNPEAHEYGPSPREASFSVSATSLSYTDISWDQVDVYEYWPDQEGVAALISRLDALPGERRMATIDGRAGTVIVEPLDNGEVTKAGTGGTTYYVALPEEDPALAGLIVIHKQAQGSPEFEAEFIRFLESIRLSPTD